jgi:hypothetical protein
MLDQRFWDSRKIWGIPQMPRWAQDGRGGAEEAKMKFAAAEEATDVAMGIVKALGKNGTTYLAPRAKFLGRTPTSVPRRLQVSILTKLMRSQIG